MTRQLRIVLISLLVATACAKPTIEGGGASSGSTGVGATSGHTSTASSSTASSSGATSSGGSTGSTASQSTGGSGSTASSTGATSTTTTGTSSTTTTGTASSSGSTGSQTSVVGEPGDPCAQNGELGCAGYAQKEAVICVSGTWSPNGACPVGDNCDSKAGSNQGLCLPIDPLCADAGSGSGLCLGDGGLVVCDADLVSHTGPTACVGQTCVAGACTGACAAGQVQCSGSGVQSCQPDGQWSAPVACGSGTACHQGSCEQTCTSASQCSGRGCIGGFCGPCTQDGDCTAPTTCDTSTGDCVIPDGGCSSDGECQSLHNGSPAWWCDAALSPPACALGCVADSLCATPQTGCCNLAAGDSCDPVTHTCQGRSACQLVDGGSPHLSGNADCDFWGALISNSSIDPAFTGGVTNQGIGTSLSQFAFVVSNTSPEVAHVGVTTRGLYIDGGALDPGTTEIIYLPWQEICGSGQANVGYHLTSDVPVTASQFNPVAASLGPDSGVGPYSYSNDASLLLPTHLLGTDYVVVAQEGITLGSDLNQSRSNTGTNALAGSMSVVATRDATHVTIRFAGAALSTADTNNVSYMWHKLCGSTQGSVASVAKGQTATFALNAGDVLQFWTDAPASDVPTCGASDFSTSGIPDACRWPEDFTGTVVSSDLPVAVFGGADCSIVPYTAAACDHLEEAILPFKTWGTRSVGVKSAQYSGASAGRPDVWRAIAGCGTGSCPNGTQLTITPAIAAGYFFQGEGCGGNCACSSSTASTTCTLPPMQSGQVAPWIEFEHASSFVADSDQPVMLAQYLVSESAAGSSATTGDPSLILIPPVAQWSSHYVVLAPTTFNANYLNLTVLGDSASTCTACDAVQVDGSTLPTAEWSNIPGTSYFSAVHALSAFGVGAHAVNGNGNPLGAVVTGYDSYASYGYAGGLNLAAINPNRPGQ